MTGHNGMVWYRDPDSRRLVCLRMRQSEDGRWEVGELYVAPAAKPISTDDLRGIPLGWLESMCNGPEMQAQLSERRETGSTLTMEQIAQATEGARKVFHSYRRTHKPRAAPRIEIPRTRPYPDTFYAAVAAAYISEASSGKPATRISELTGKPLSTVHRWISECRRRELLPPARQGKAG